MECVVFMGRQRNASCSSGGLGQNRRWKRGLAYRRTEETNLLHSEQGPADREGCGVPQNGGNGPPTVETGSCSSGGVWRTTKRDSMGYCSSPLSTSSSLHGLLFIHRRPPLASTCDCSSTGSCSSSLHRALVHRLLFNQPSPRGSCSTTLPRATVHPALHRLLFNQPSTGSCSSSPPQARSIGVLFIQRHQRRNRSGSVSSE